ncbi:ribonucleotide reductase inhibitor-domain-containing protein [Aspergillus unguis]
MAAAKPDLSKRRRFQPPITTFFTASSDSDNSLPSHLSYNHYSAVTNSPTPVVPAKIQASLLSVGMRVRKSLADGYKTNQAKTEKYNMVSYNQVTQNTLKPTTATYNTPSTRSELAPFSGMGKANEYISAQPLPHPTNYNLQHDHQIKTDEDNDAFSLPPSSQESIDSELETSTPIPAFAQKKRTHREFDAYDDEDEEIDPGNDTFTPPTWQDPLHLHPVTHATGRTILSPTVNHQRRRVFAAQKHKPGYGQTMDLDDFEEPAFLRKREEVDMDVEY